MGEYIELFRAHAARYPLAEAQDAWKLAIQSVFGGGHLVAAGIAADRLAAEYAVTPQDGGALTEAIGARYVRLRLAALDAAGLSPALAARVFALSANEDAAEYAAHQAAAAYKPQEDAVPLAEAMASPQGRSDFDAAVADLYAVVREGAFAFDADALDEYRRAYYAAGCPLPSHSDAYRAAYAPAYRVIGARWARLLPLVAAIDRLRAAQERVVVVIDGRAASGKTTAAALLAELFGASVVHADDFFLPPAKRTPARLSEPGGNLDYERFADEVVAGLAAGIPFGYRVFDCGVMDFGGTARVDPRAVTIVEGAYCLHPRFGDYCDLRVFSDITPDEQRARILARNGAAMLARFERDWIPMEERYFEAFGIPASSSVRLG